MYAEVRIEPLRDPSPLEASQEEGDVIQIFKFNHTPEGRISDAQTPAALPRL